MARFLPAWLQGSPVAPAINRSEQQPPAAREILPSNMMAFAPTILRRLDSLRFHFPDDPAPRAEQTSRFHEDIFGGLHPAAGAYRDNSVHQVTRAHSSGGQTAVAPSIAERMTAIFGKLEAQNYLLKTPKEEYVCQLANFVHAVDKVRPFDVGTEFVTQVIASHLGQHAGFKVDLLSVSSARWFSALASADQENNLVPLRDILRRESRPERAIAFESAMSERKINQIRYHGELDHAYGLVNQAVGGDRGHWRIERDKLTGPQKEVIHKVQQELEAGRLHDMPTGAERAWYFGIQRSPDI